MRRFDAYLGGMGFFSHMQIIRLKIEMSPTISSIFTHTGIYIMNKYQNKPESLFCSVMMTNLPPSPEFSGLVLQ